MRKAKAQPGFAIFGFGNILATNIVKRAVRQGRQDQLDKLLTAMEALFKESDKNNDGKLDSASWARRSRRSCRCRSSPRRLRQKRDRPSPDRASHRRRQDYPRRSL